jgi:hypothetical protein
MSKVPWDAHPLYLLKTLLPREAEADSGNFEQRKLKLLKVILLKALNLVNLPLNPTQ